jgi:EmrB/QacA subfamily drug resistance transporter
MHTPPQKNSNAGLIATVILAAFVAPMNSTMMAVAVAPIRNEFGISTGSAAWLISAYLVVIAIMQPLGGRLGDQLGRQRLFMIGVSSFIIVSALATFAWSFPSVVFFRVLQAVAGGLIFPNGIALLRARIPAERRARTFGMVGAIMGLSVAVGPTFGGVLTTFWTWRALFAINIPLMVASLLLALRYLPADSGKRAEVLRPDIAGSAFLFVALSLIAFTGTWLGTQTGSRFIGALLLTAGVVFSALLFVRQQGKAANPLVDLHFFRARSFAAGTTGTLFASFTMYVILITVPLYVQDIRGGSEARAGLLLSVMAFSLIGMGPIAGALADRVGRRTPAIIGALILLAGAGFTNLLNADTPWWVVAAMLLTIGSGMAMLVSIQQTASIESLPPEHGGSAAGIFSTTRYIGGLIGTALIASVVGTGNLNTIGSLHLLTLAVTISAVGAVLSATQLHHWPPDMGKKVTGQRAAQESEVEHPLPHA